MKKMYLLGLALSMFSMVNAQTTVINDDFESYSLGSYYGTHWDNWFLQSDESLNIKVVNNRASSGTKSGYIGPHNSENGQDALLVFPTVYTQGKVTTEWKMYVPADSMAYFNMQSTEIPGEFYAFDCFMNTYEAADTINGGISLQNKIVWRFSDGTYSYVYGYAPLVTNQWFTLKQVIDLDNSTLSLYVDNTEATYYYYGASATPNPFPGAQKSVKSIDFYSLIDSSNLDLYNSYYIDDVKVTTENTNGIATISKNSNLLSVYPNPAANGNINISLKGETIQNVEVVNINGQTVLSATANASSTSLNVSTLAAGMYTVKVSTKDKAYTKNFVVK